ncbi:hypothetical protein [Mammaliicoccus lentus]|uniref:hypothetical protein n=1 Tax=Mammaliicoccus lentus TaxID=42858 RepID=UPI001072C65A|nr:hypothetical protein [Mammaliicoccus lentus]MBF0795201.1 hypothetical protein [Mammaliicoccus lentus]TFV14601.1 hypothetical protein E4T78_11085 [Mammaliicoccus lentus]
MKISIKVPQEVLDIINEKGVCLAKNETEFSSYAYNYLKEITGYNGLFFGILHNEYMLNNKERIKELMDMSSTNNSIYLLLDIPKSEYLAHDYYTFTDLIYYHDEESDRNTIDLIKKELKETFLNREVQCVFNRIEKAWVEKIYKNIRIDEQPQR